MLTELRVKLPYVCEVEHLPEISELLGARWGEAVPGIEPPATLRSLGLPWWIKWKPLEAVKSRLGELGLGVIVHQAH